MKVEMKADGLLSVTPENELEAYALSQWVLASAEKQCKCCGSRGGGKLSISGELSEKPSATHYSEQWGMALTILRREIFRNISRYPAKMLTKDQIMIAVNDASCAALMEYEDGYENIP